eukprot:SAG31_NODE_3329_length_4400_cov_2.494071_4_plen_163_part_00
MEQPCFGREALACGGKQFGDHALCEVATALMGGAPLWNLEVGDGAEISANGLRSLLAGSLLCGLRHSNSKRAGCAQWLSLGLRRLRLYQCDAGDEAAAVLAAAMQAPSCWLRTLDLSNVLLGDRGAISLATALPASMLQEYETAPTHAFAAYCSMVQTWMIS